MKKAVELLTEMEILVGVPEDKDARKSGGDINNAALAYIHDNGAPEANIPARPFMRPGIKDAQDRVVKRLEMAAKAAFRGDLEGVRANFEAAGLLAQNGVRARINEGIPPPLKAGTIAARRRRGRSGTKPLIDTGQLRNAITYVVRKRKKK